MAGQVVLITGALSGIGRATAVAFAKEEAKIVISGRRVEEGKALAKELASLGAEAAFVRADVRYEDDVRHLVEKSVALHGRIDVAVNNAGTEGQPGPLTAETPETYAATFDTNVLGLLLCMKHELRAMKQQSTGSIINVSSAYGKIGVANASVYAAAKHAVEGLTKSAALEAAEYGVRVNAVAPGPTSTPMLERFTGGQAGLDYMASIIPMKRIGRTEEVAGAIVFLASAQAGFITGQSISADGGLTAA
jgi:NAD(P)-dependent dehydrogenase (short-subunit alcohol dehydrogenase family)